jgi:hypothetical protein
MKKEILLIGLLITLFAPSIAYPASSQDILGTWAFSQIGHRNSGTWYIWAGKVVLRNDGTGLMTGQLNDNGVITNGPWPFSYTTSGPPPPAEMIGIQLTIPGFSDPLVGYYFIKAGRDLLLLIGSQYTDQQPFGLMIRLDPSKTYAASDLNGRYWGIGYQLIKSTPNKYAAWSLTAEADGVGTNSNQSYRNENGFIIAQNFSNPYTVSADGNIITTGPQGYLSGDGRSMISSRTDTPTDLFFSAFIKQGGGGYSSQILGGLWLVGGFGDDTGAGFYSLSGSMQCNPSGACQIDGSKQAGGVKSDYHNEATFSVEPEGTFKTSPTSPSYAGAIGDDGNIFFANRSFDPTHHDQRQILIGVRFTRYIFLPLILN